MAIPDFQSFFKPMLSFASDGEEHTLKEAVDALAREFELTEEEKNIMLPSGQKKFHNRCAWAKTFLKKAGLIEYPRRGIFTITDRGLEVYEEDPPELRAKYLRRFPEFRVFNKGGTDNSAEDDSSLNGQEDLDATAEAESSPEELVAVGYKELQKSLASELLDLIKSSSPEFFEQLVVDLMLAMGYGGSREEAGRKVGKSGDGGVDGVINEDRLGLDVVYLQAKRWEGTVGRPAVQGFAGSLEGFRANKGVMITTSSFTRDAREYVSLIGKKIVLIDGWTLAELMIEYNVGVSKVAEYVIKRVDSDYFIDE